MTATDRKPTVESIEHLDFNHAPPCEAKAASCGGANPATYLAVYRWCCVREILICTPCVARKMASGTAWKCTRCGRGGFRGTWLDMVTLHPLGGPS